MTVTNNYKSISDDLVKVSVYSLTLTAFRNYEHFTLNPMGRNIVLTGVNGVGKTNLLEAVSLLASGRGLRGARLSQLQNQRISGIGWGVAMELATADSVIKFGTAMQCNKEEKRIIKLNGNILKSQLELTKYFTILWHTPQQDKIFTESLSVRRRFLDKMVCNFITEHSSHIAKYEYLMRERNRLLAQQLYDENWLASIERKMAETSLAIAAARVEVVQYLRESIESLPPAFVKADIILAGYAEQMLQEGDISALEIEENMVNALASSRKKDALSGRSSHGAHRLELQVIYRPKKLEAAFCSTGEQKALLLCLLLAQSYALQIYKGKLPILLLDEVVAHLDIKRRQSLFSLLAELGMQVWLTGTDESLFSGFDADALRINLTA